MYILAPPVTEGTKVQSLQQTSSLNMDLPTFTSYCQHHHPCTHGTPHPRLWHHTEELMSQQRKSSCGLCPGNSPALSCIPFLVLSLKHFTTPIVFPLGIIHPIPHTFVNSFIFFLGCPTTSGCEERWGQFTHSSQSSSGPENLVFQDTSHLESQYVY